MEKYLGKYLPKWSILCLIRILTNGQLEIFLIPSHTTHRRTRPVKCWPLQSAKVEAPSEATPSLMAPYGQRNIDTNVCLGFWSQNKKGWEKNKTLYYIPLVWLLKSSSLYHWNHPFLHLIDLCCVCSAFKPTKTTEKNNQLCQHLEAMQPLKGATCGFPSLDTWGQQRLDHGIWPNYYIITPKWGIPLLNHFTIWGDLGWGISESLYIICIYTYTCIYIYIYIYIVGGFDQFETY